MTWLGLNWHLHAAQWERWTQEGLIRPLIQLLALSGLPVTARDVSLATFSAAAQSAREARERRERDARDAQERREEGVSVVLRV